MTAALELRARGHRVSLMDPGPLPHPLAASTDISKVIRMEYGPDEDYMALAEDSRDGWLAWNEAWKADRLGSLYHVTGVLMVCKAPMDPGGFEFESWRMLKRRGHGPERMDAETIARRFPAWSTGHYVDGFFHRAGGYAESGRVVEQLLLRAEREGVVLHPSRKIVALLEDGGRVSGVRDADGGEIHVDEVLVAAGAWTGKLVPELAGCIKITGHPVFHLQPRDPKLFEAERFPTFTADVARTGFYGFPLAAGGVIKVANHGQGKRIDPDAPRSVTERDEKRMRAFVREAFPALEDAPVVFTRLCLYADTADEDFWIARHPDRAGLTVASGDSGHGFKFAPLLGTIIADAMEGVQSALLDKFRWRPEIRMERGREAARCHSEMNEGA